MWGRTSNPYDEVLSAISEATGGVVLAQSRCQLDHLHNDELERVLDNALSYLRDASDIAASHSDHWDEDENNAGRCR